MSWSKWVSQRAAASPVQDAASASGEAKGAAVKPWQERARERWPDFPAEQLGQWAATECKDAEIADWRALAKRAKAAQPSGAVLMPKELTAESGAKAALIGEFREVIQADCPKCCGDGEDCDECDGAGTIPYSVPVGWSNIKAIYASAVELFATPAPGQEAAQEPVGYIKPENLAALLNGCSPVLIYSPDCKIYGDVPLYTAPVAQKSEQPKKMPMLSLSVALNDRDVKAITEYTHDLMAWAREAEQPQGGEA